MLNANQSPIIGKHSKHFGEAMKTLEIIYLQLRIYAADIELAGIEECGPFIRGHEAQARFAIAKIRAEAQKQMLVSRIRAAMRGNGITAMSA